MTSIPAKPMGMKGCHETRRHKDIRQVDALTQTKSEESIGRIFILAGIPSGIPRALPKQCLCQVDTIYPLQQKVEANIASGWVSSAQVVHLGISSEVQFYYLK